MKHFHRAIELRRSVPFARVLLITTLVVVSACASQGPIPQLTARVLSEPAGMTVVLNGKPLGVAPLDLKLQGLGEAASLTVEREDDERAVERRIQVLGPTNVQVQLTLRDEPSDLAKKLGLEDILVFDYGAKASFEVDSFEVAPSLEPLLMNQAQVLKSRFSGLDLFVCGHTDNSGEEDHNSLLSLRRAQAVADVLTNHGLDPNQLRVQGFADDYPLAPNSTSEGQALNRRTEIVIGQ